MSRPTREIAPSTGEGKSLDFATVLHQCQDDLDGVFGGPEQPSTVAVEGENRREGADSRPRLIIADDDPVVRSLLEGSLRSEFEIVGIASDGEDVVELARVLRPAAALVDVDMPKGGGMAAVKGIGATSPHTAIVMLSGDESEQVVRDLMLAGAIAYRRKGTPAGTLAESLTDAISMKREPSSGLLTAAV